MPTTPTIAAIQCAVARAFDITKAEMLGNRKTHTVAHPRLISMALCRELTDASLQQIGRAYRRDHTCIVNAVKRSPVLLAKYPEYAVKRRAVVQALSSPQP